MHEPCAGHIVTPPGKASAIPVPPAYPVNPTPAVQRVDAQRLALALDHSANTILLCDRNAIIQYSNSGFFRMFGYSMEEARGQRPQDLLSGPHTDPETIRHLGEQHRNGQPHRADLLGYRRDGSPLWVSVVATPVPAADGGIDCFINVLTDITAAKTHEVLQNKVLDALVRDVPLAETMALICREIERVAPGVVSSVHRVDAGHTLRLVAAPGLPASLVDYLDGQPVSLKGGASGAAVCRNRPVIVADIATDPLCAPHSGELLTAGLRACWSNPIRSGTGQVLGALTFHYREPREPAPWHRALVELSLHLCLLALEREQIRQRVHQLAFYDALTGLPNRVMFSARAEQLLASAQHLGQQVAALFINLDRFKRINETQGHSAGDDLLRDMAQRLAALAGPGALLGRQVGDEFLLLLPACSAVQAAALCERLLAAIAAPLYVGQISVHTSASIGVAMYPVDGRDIDTLLRHADLAMYRAKDEGGGNFRFFSLEMNRVAQERVVMEAALRNALGNDELCLHYQPQLCSRTLRLLGVEALLRWEHPQMGSIPPARFIPLAEECGLMDELSLRLLRQACSDIARWRGNGIQIPRVSVNLSASNFDNPALPRQLRELLGEFGITPADLVLEITESLMLSAHAHALKNLDDVHALGFCLSLDDFGTGYSSLSQLHRLPISELKLDRSFVQDIEHSESARSLITSVLRIGENLGKQVVAEGVETEGQRRFLTSQGCDLLQGFLFSPALPVAALEHWLEQHLSSLVTP